MRSEDNIFAAARNVVALFDFEANNDNELSFKAGDVIEMLEEGDNSGWCKGRKAGNVGFYPATYIKGVYLIFCLHIINLQG